MIPPADVSAVLVTRGDVPMDQIRETVAHAGIEDVVVWNNTERTDVSCYGRFAGIAEAKNEWVFVQDDDLTCPVARILEHVDPERDRWTIVANNRPPEEWPLVGLGAVFHRDLAECFQRYVDAYGIDTEFYRTADVIFGYLNAYRRVWVGYDNLAWQCAPNSMYLQPRHMEAREQARARTLELPDRVPA